MSDEKRKKENSSENLIGIIRYMIGSPEIWYTIFIVQ